MEREGGERSGDVPSRTVMGLPALLVVAITTALLPAGGVSSASSAPSHSDQPLERALEEGRRASHAQSLSVAVVFEDGRVWTGATGIADVKTGRRATPSTAYAGASVTKSFVAAAAMQLVDEKVLTLDEPVARWLSDLHGADRITLRQLLGHTSGLTETPFHERQTFAWTPEQVLVSAVEPACAPGTCFRYSDNGYVAVGEVIARATGQPLAEVLRDRILEPLGLTRTWLQGLERPRGSVAPASTPGSVSVFEDPEGNVPSTEFVTRTGASGAVAVTARDLATFGDALFRRDLVTAHALVVMTDIEQSAPLPCPDVEHCADAYGLGVGVETMNGWRALGHSGSTGSLFAYFPQQRVTIAVVSNGGADPYSAASAVAEAIPPTRDRVDLFTVSADGRDARTLAHGAGQRLAPAISPDGTKIAYTRVRGANYAIVVADIDGSHPRVVARDGGSPTWSPDGARLAFSGRRGDHGEIYVIDADGAHRRRLTDGAAWSDGPSWSPNGDLIAYGYEGSDTEIRVVRPDGSDMRTVVRVPVRGPNTGHPRWSPDGSQLVFTGGDGGDTDIQLVALDGSSLVTLTADHVPEAAPAWASDGRIAFTRLGDVFAVTPNHPDSLQRITKTAGDEFALDWFPDASRIMFAGRRSQ